MIAAEYMFKKVSVGRIGSARPMFRHPFIEWVQLRDFTNSKILEALNGDGDALRHCCNSSHWLIGTICNKREYCWPIPMLSVTAPVPRGVSAHLPLIFPKIR
jgi:hypothetical protein